jgi:hypothetical protein
MHNIAQKQIFFLKLPELYPDLDLVVKFPDPEKGPDLTGSGSATLLPKSTYSDGYNFKYAYQYWAGPQRQSVCLGPFFSTSWFSDSSFSLGCST